VEEVRKRERQIVCGIGGEKEGKEKEEKELEGERGKRKKGRTQKNRWIRRGGENEKPNFEHRAKGL